MASLKELGLRKTVDFSPEEAESKIRESLKKEGFGILTEIDVKGTLKAKLGVDFRPYKILGACNPTLAHQALNQDLEIGLLLPCNVIIYEDTKGKTVISIVNPKVILSGIENESMNPLAEEALQKVTKALEAI